MDSRIIEGDCLRVCSTLLRGAYALAYIDPPFFTRRNHSSLNREGTNRFTFSDSWESVDEYKEFLRRRLEVIRKCLRRDGSIVVHCDRNASHHVRCLLDDVFGADQFRSEIIWMYKRWSNSQKGLMPAHQTLFWYSVSEAYKFNSEYGSYSPTTNIDQILQRRTRDLRGKSVYARDASGEAIYGIDKRGVPLSDVWDIPFLNPKARERVGYPTQKPVELLMRLIRLMSDPGDAILDPFCGSGTSLVAATELGRAYTGIDISSDAVALASERLANPVITRSVVSAAGRESFEVQDEFVRNVLAGLQYLPVQRNSGIDGIITATETREITFIKVQRPYETLADAIAKLRRAAVSKGPARLVVIQTHPDLLADSTKDPTVSVFASIEFALSKLKTWEKQSAA